MTLRILTIGNSLAENATRYIEDMAAAGGGPRLIVGRTNLGGCSLEKHGNLVEQCDLLPDVRPYLLRVTGKAPRPATLRHALEDEPWDFITLQQVSTLSWQPESYRPHLDRLIEVVRNAAPKARILLHQTWAYRCDGPLLASFGIGQEGMFNGIRAAVAQAAAAFGLSIIPCGLAFQKARAALCFAPDPAFDPASARPMSLPDASRSLIVGHRWATGNTASGRAELHMDERHGNALGCFLAHATWCEMFTGKPAGSNPFRPEGVSLQKQTTLQAAAHEAVMEAGGPFR